MPIAFAITGCLIRWMLGYRTFLCAARSICAALKATRPEVVWPRKYKAKSRGLAVSLILQRSIQRRMLQRYAYHKRSYQRYRRHNNSCLCKHGEAGMMGENQDFEFLDVLTIVSFIMQLQNQSKLFGLHDVQDDNNRVAREIHAHLETQDEKINRILEAFGIEG